MKLDLYNIVIDIYNNLEEIIKENNSSDTRFYISEKKVIFKELAYLFSNKCELIRDNIVGKVQSYDIIKDDENVLYVNNNILLLVSYKDGGSGNHDPLMFRIIYNNEKNIPVIDDYFIKDFDNVVYYRHRELDSEYMEYLNIDKNDFETINTKHNNFKQYDIFSFEHNYINKDEEEINDIILPDVCDYYKLKYDSNNNCKLEKLALGILVEDELIIDKKRDSYIETIDIMLKQMSNTEEKKLIKK